MNSTYDIFISYRRKDDFGHISGRDQARIIADKLNQKHYKTFFDYEAVKDGNFEKVIIPAIETCKVFILFLTQGALDRCVNDSDWVRREIETAMSTDCKIINVTPNYSFTGSDFPDNLPKSISGIKDIHISCIDFKQLLDVSLDQLIRDRISIQKGGCNSDVHSIAYEELMESLQLFVAERLNVDRSNLIIDSVIVHEINDRVLSSFDSSMRIQKNYTIHF